MLGLVCAAVLARAEAVPDAGALVRGADAALRGETTMRAVRLTVVASPTAAPRVVAFHSWDDRRRGRAFLRVLSPAKHAGTSYLRLPPNVWSHVRRTGRTRLVLANELLAPWLGTDFTLDDWIFAIDDVDDYTHTVLRSEEDADGRRGIRAHVVASRPPAGLDPAWSRIEAWIAAEDGRPLRRDYFGADGRRARTVRFFDFREVEGRSFPHRWVMTSAGAPGRETRVEFESVAFDRAVDETVFTPRNLKAPVVP